MADGAKSEPDGAAPVDDNRGPENELDAETWKRVDRVVLTIARLIGRRIAREDFEAHSATHNNLAKTADNAADEADKE
jgi:hypothetical protein